MQSSQSRFYAKFPSCCIKFSVSRTEYSAPGINTGFPLNCINDAYVLFKNYFNSILDYMTAYRMYFNRGESFTTSQFTQH